MKATMFQLIAGLICLQVYWRNPAWTYIMQGRNKKTDRSRPDLHAGRKGDYRVWV